MYLETYTVRSGILVASQHQDRGVFMKIIDTEESVGNAAVELFERVLNAKLPVAYRQFLLQHNGGYPSPENFRSLDGQEESSVQDFYRINSKNRHDDLLDCWKLFRDRIPDDFLAIGSDPGGNQICIAVRGKFHGKIFFWDHEMEVEEGANPGMKNMSLLADNFTSFLEALY